LALAGLATITSNGLLLFQRDVPMFEDHLPHMSQEKSDQFKHGDGEIRPKFHGIFRPEMSCQAFHGAKDVGVGLVESIHGIQPK